MKLATMSVGSWRSLLSEYDERGRVPGKTRKRWSRGLSVGQAAARTALIRKPREAFSNLIEFYASTSSCHSGGAHKPGGQVFLPGGRAFLQDLSQGSVSRHLSAQRF